MASQSTVGDGDVTSLHDLITCLICFEPFTSPKMLQCGHTFCEGCLQSFYDANQETRLPHSKKLCCPTCREETPFPGNGIAALRNDFRVHKMKDVFGRMTARNTPSENVCDPCRAHEKIVIAKGYCSRCRVNYCGECLRKHNRSQLFKDHKVFEKSALHKSPFAECMCKIHKYEDSGYFCQTCQTVACTMCIVEEHSDSTQHDVAEVDVLYKQHMNAIRDLQETIVGKVKRQSSVKVVLEALQSRILESYHQTAVDIKEKAAMMMASIEKQEADLLSKLEQKRDLELQPLRKKLNVVEACIVNDEVDSKHQIDILAEYERLIKRLRTLAESEETTCSDERSLQVSFLAGQQEPNIGRLEVEQRGIVDNRRDACVQSVVNVGDTFDGSRTQDLTSTSPAKSPYDTPGVKARAPVPVSLAPRNVVLVRGINQKTTKGLLTMFFQSKKRSGGGPLENVDYRIFRHEATLTFYNTEDACVQSVVNVGDTFDGSRTQDLTSTSPAKSPYESPLMSARAPVPVSSVHRNVVLVRGINQMTTKELLTMFFQSRKRSGGGPLKHVDYRIIRHEATLTFLNIEEKDLLKSAKVATWDYVRVLQ
ncbi:hypothetical protein LSAT2_027126 [Lamellibrachia satsuma]|nr:hypothetical protein LSAT2_027126 [Lamellibrachia satsuma]